jgi:hypothetical protein
MVLAFGLAPAAWSQGMGGRGPQVPQLLGSFKPVVGSGAQYQMTGKDRNMTFAYVILGKEEVDGATGYWMEIRTLNPQMGGEMVMKQLVVQDGPTAQVKRMIMQAPGRPPMEFPMAMMAGMGQGRQPAGQARGTHDTSPGEIVGTETITVPAGTFECQHFRKQEPRGTVDVWVSSQVAPYGTVKVTSGEMTMTLEKVLSNESSHIKGEPQKFEMPGASR